jgi:hypothetical protein
MKVYIKSTENSQINDLILSASNLSENKNKLNPKVAEGKN